MDLSLLNMGFLSLSGLENPPVKIQHDETAGWIQKARNAAGNRFIYCSDKGCNFNQIQQDRLNQPHLYAWHENNAYYLGIHPHSHCGSVKKSDMQKPISTFEKEEDLIAAIQQYVQGGNRNA